MARNNTAASGNSAFKADGALFSKAYNKIKTAKTYINTCKDLISKIGLSGYSNLTNLKNNINNSGINSLIQKIEDTKISLMKLDTEFADRYMSSVHESLIYNTIDVDKLSDEERNQYYIELAANQVEYYRNCLYMLEKYEESGMLTDEMQNELKYYRAMVKQYDIQDNMIGLDVASEEYINLFNQNAECARDLIKYNSSLSDEDKAKMLADFEIEYNSQLETINLQRELNNLYAMKENNSNFWHPFVENEIDESIISVKMQLGIASDDEIAYSRMNGWEKAWENTKTFGVSTFTGIMSAGEAIIDGTLMLTAGTVGFFNEDVATWTSDFVGMSASNLVYDSIVDNGAINSVSAYSGWHTAGNVLGSVAGYAALSFLPGGAITTAISGGVAAMGSSSQMAYQGGATHGDAYLTGAISFGIGALSGAAVNKIGRLASSSTSISQSLGYTAMGMGVSVLEPVVNSITEYSLFAKDDVNYDNFWDYYVSTGLLNTVIAAGAGGLSVGAQGLAGYMGSKKAMQEAAEEAIKAKTNVYKDYSIESMYEAMADAGYFTREDVPLEELKKMFKGTATIEIDGVKITVTNEDAIKMTMMSIMDRGVTGGGLSSSELYNIYNLPYRGDNPLHYPNRIPEPGSLELLESRIWYLEAESSIPGKLNDYKLQYINAYEVEPPSKLCAEFCFNERNDLRQLARGMMSDDVMRAYLNATETHFSFEVFVEAKRAKIAGTQKIPLSSVTDDMVYESIINSSTSSRDILNMLLGIGGKKSGK